MEDGPDLEFGDLVRIPAVPIGIVDGQELIIYNTSARQPLSARLILNFNQELIRRVPR